MWFILRSDVLFLHFLCAFFFFLALKFLVIAVVAGTSLNALRLTFVDQNVWQSMLV